MQPHRRLKGMETTNSGAPQAWLVLEEAMVDAEQQYADVFNSLWPRLYRLARTVSGSDHLAEDAVQSAFARAYASWSKVQRADRPEAYLRRMVLNEVLTVQRKAWFRRERSHDVLEMDASSASAEDEIADHDQVWAAVLALPPRQRAVIVLRYYEDLSEAEIADALRCSRGTVKSQASAALKNLRRSGAITTGEL